MSSSQAALSFARSVFPAELLIPLPAIQALYDSFEQKSPGLAKRAQVRSQYPEDVESILARAQPAFTASAFSMSADSLVFVRRLFEAAQFETVLEFGAGVTTFALPPTLPNSARYISIDEDETYAAGIRSKVAELYPDRKIDVLSLTPAKSPTLRIALPERRVRPRSLVGLRDALMGLSLTKPPDVVIIDGPSRRVPWGRYTAVADISSLLPAGTIILLDDALRHREVSILGAWQRAGLVDVLGVYCIGTGTALAVRR